MNIFFETRKTSLPVTVSSYLFYYILSGFVFFMLNLPIVSLLITFFGFFIISLNYESSMKKRLIAVICSHLCLLTVYLLVIVVFSDNMFQLFVPGTALSFSVYIFLIAGLLTYSVASLMCRFENIKKNAISSPVFLISFVVIQASSLIMLFLVLTHLPQAVMIVVTALVLIINMFMFYLYDTLSASYENEVKSNFYAQEKAYYFFQCQLMQESADKLNSVRHDIKTHLFALKDFTAENKAASEYINCLIENIEKGEIYSDTGNTSFDSIINFKLSNAEKHGITTNVRIIMPPKLNIAPVDAVTIMGNLLDNAIEAAIKTEDKKISLDISFDRGCLLIKTDNTFDGTVVYEQVQPDGKKVIATSKKDSGHGYGFKNIRKSIGKYNGYMEILHRENVFSVGIMLYLKETVI